MNNDDEDNNDNNNNNNYSNNNNNNNSDSSNNKNYMNIFFLFRLEQYATIYQSKRQKYDKNIEVTANSWSDIFTRERERERESFI